jgi:hypothetical protein
MVTYLLAVREEGGFKRLMQGPIRSPCGCHVVCGKRQRSSEAESSAAGTSQIATPSCRTASEVGVVHAGGSAGSGPGFGTGHV